MAKHSFSASTDLRDTANEGLWTLMFWLLSISCADSYSLVHFVLIVMFTALRHAGQRFSLTPYITPRLTPTGTPKIMSTGGSPRGYSAIGSPQKTSGQTSPTKSQYEGKAISSSWYPSSQQSSAANSPPRGRPLSGQQSCLCLCLFSCNTLNLPFFALYNFIGCTPRIDGKEFFRQARSRLSYEQFSAFLANIKELNAQKQSREETLRKAEEIFGMDNKDLLLFFQRLINRNTH